MPKGHVPLWTVELPHDRPRSPSRSDAWERALSSGIIPALPPLQDPSPRNGDQQRFAFALTIPVLVAIHPKDVSKLKVNLAHEPDTVRVRKILHLVTDKIRATGFDARCVDDAAGADLLVKRPAKAGDEHPFAHADKWTVSKAVGVAGFGFSEEDPARFFEKGVRHAAMELTTPMLTRLFRGEQRVDEVEVAVVLGHLKRALDVFEPVAEFPMAVRCWKRDTGKRGVARWDVLEMAAVSAAAVMFEVELQELVDRIQPDPLVWPAHSNRTSRPRLTVRESYVCPPLVALSGIMNSVHASRFDRRSEQCWTLCTSLCERRFSSFNEKTVAEAIKPLARPGDGVYLSYDLSTFKVELPLHTNDGSILLRLRGSTVDPLAIRDWSEYLEGFLCASLDRLAYDVDDWEAESSLADFAPSTT